MKPAVGKFKVHPVVMGWTIGFMMAVTVIVLYRLGGNSNDLNTFTAEEKARDAIQAVGAEMKRTGVDRVDELRPPAWCGTLMRNPLPYSKDGCTVYSPEVNCVEGPPRFFSQYYQDMFLFVNHFSKAKGPGTYLDVGAHTPYQISNSFFFDKCLGWSGICVEAEEKFFPGIYQERTCHLVPTCVSDVDRVVEYVLAGNLGGVQSTNKNLNSTEAWAEFSHRAPVIRKKCFSLTTVMRKVRVDRVNYMSLDVEGHELQVLQGVEWDKVQIDIIGVEGGKSSMAGSFLLDMNYKKIENDHETFFIHPKVIFGSPDF